MIIIDPLISNFVFQCQLSIFSFYLLLHFFFLLSTEKQELPHPLHLSIRLLLSSEFCFDVIHWLAVGHREGGIHRTDNALPQSTGGRPPVSALTQQWAPGGGTGAFLGKALPVINAQKNNSSPKQRTGICCSGFHKRTTELAFWFDYKFLKFMPNQVA